MSAGNFYTRRNASTTTAIPSAGTNVDASWDTLVKDDGSIVTYSSPNLQVDTGLYLVMYSEVFHTPTETSDSTNRLEFQGEILVGGSVYGGFGQDYIRQDSNQFECSVSGYAFVQVTSDNTNIAIRFYRTDNSTEVVERLPGYGGVTIIEMDDAAHNFGFASTTSSEATSGTTERTLALTSSDKMDTGFSLGSNQITVTNAGRYLVTYSMDISMSGTARENVRGWLRKNGSTKITGSQSHCYMRGSDGTQDGALTWIGIIDASANDSFDVRWDCPTSQTITAASGAKLQMWQLPSIADTCIVEATTGDFSSGDFTWDTNPHIDTDSFTHTVGTSSITVDQDDHCLVFATFSKLTDQVARAYPLVRIKNDDIRSYISGGMYERNNSTYGSAVTVAGLLNEVSQDSDIIINSTPQATTGTLTNASGQFSVLSLESIWNYTYVFPPKIDSFNTTNGFNWGDTNLIISGSYFGSTQGTGKVEFWSDTSGTTKSTQSVDSWSATSIQIDSVQGSLSNNTYIYLVVTDDNSSVSNKLKVQVGIIPYSSLISYLYPDHYWKLDNSYSDTGETGPARDMTSGVVGTQVMTTNTIADDSTYCVQFNDVLDRREIADSPNMNITIDSAERTVAGWIQLGGIQQSVGAIWKEGGSVQNLAFIVGIGNQLLAQGADTPGNAINAQAWSDFRLTSNRPYHICLRYSLTEDPKEFRLYVDGEEQTETSGNPLGTGSFNSHSGDVGWGDPDNTLETGGTDVAYAGQEDCKYSHWLTWSDNSAGTNAGALDKTTEIRDVLFRRGALPKYTISSGTQSAMQTALDVYKDTEIPDWPLGFRIVKDTSDNIELTADNITFNSRVTAQLEWRGSGTLTWVLINGSVLDSNRIFASNGGTITIVNAPPVTITVKDASTGVAIQGARVLIEADSGGDLTSGTDIISDLTDSNGEVSTNHRYTSDQPIVGYARSASGVTKYIQGDLSGTITNEGFNGTIFLIKDE